MERMPEETELQSALPAKIKNSSGTYGLSDSRNKEFMKQSPRGRHRKVLFRDPNSSRRNSCLEVDGDGFETEVTKKAAYKVLTRKRKSIQS